MTRLAKTGAALFIAWGLVHVLGGASILAALSDSATTAYSAYRGSGQAYDALSGSVLGYFAYLLIVTGIAVAIVGWTMNWRNSKAGLAINTLLIAAIEAGLIGFLVLPGYVSWAQASIGLVPFMLATLASGIACRHLHGPATA